MGKKIDVDEFISRYKNFSDRRTAVVALSEEYSVSTDTIYRWIRKYITGIKTTQNRKDTSDMGFFDIIKTYSEEYDDGGYRSVGIDMNIDSGGILIVMLSDMHIGSRFTDLGRIENDMKIIKETDNVYAFMLGDILDTGGNKTTPHAGILHDQVMKYRDAKQIAIKLYEYVGEKILVTTSGCHGAWTFNDTGEYLEEDLVKYTETEIFLDHGGTVIMTLGDQEYKFFVSHKIKGGGFLNPTRGIFRLNEMGMDFDIGVGAHNHQTAISVLPRRDKFVYAIKCGSYKTLDTFANKSGFVKTPMSIPGVYISADKKLIVPFIDWHDGLKYLGD